MKRTNKIFAILLLAAMLLPACAKDGDKTPAGTTDPSESGTTVPATADTTAPPETEDPKDSDNLPEDIDFDGADLVFYTRNKSDFLNCRLTVEDSNGEQLNDLLWDRQIAVSERLGLNLKEDYPEAVGGSTSAVMNAVKAGDNSYQLVTLRNVHSVQLASQGVAYNWAKIKNIDLEKNYWYDTINEDLRFAGKMYFAAGAYNLSSFDFTHLILINKELVSNFNLENPYELVKNGKWTFDKFAEFGLAATRDLNSDGQMTLEDAFGYMASAKQISPNFWISAGTKGIERDEKGKPVFTMATDEKFLDVLTRVYSIMWDDGIWYNDDTMQDIPDTAIEAFSENRSLMMDSTLYTVKRLREMEADFGMLPYPKYTEDQDVYYSRIEGCELPIIPIANSQDSADMAGAFLEAMASYSYKNTIPTYYEVYLKTRNSRDKESSEIMDLIFENRIFDLADTVWCDSIRDTFVRTLFGSNNRNFVSTFKKSTNTVQKTIDKAMDGFEAAE